MSWQRWNWLNDAWLPLLLATLRACWLWPCLEIVRSGLSPSLVGDLLPMPLIVVITLGGMAAARWALTGNASLLRARIEVAGLGLAAILAALWYQFYRAIPVWDVRWVSALGRAMLHWGSEVPPPFLALLIAAYLWLRGVLDGREPLNHEDIWGAFTVGFLGLAFALMAAAAGSGQLLASVSRLIFPFFAIGMAALAFSSLEPVNKPVKESGTRLGFDRYWAASVASVTVGLLGLGLALSVLVTPEMVADSLSWTSAILKILGQVLVLVFLAIAYLVFLLLEPLLTWVQSLARPDAPPPQLQLPDFQRQIEEMGQGTTPAALTLGEWPRWVGLAGLIVLIGVVFALALRRFRRSAGEETDEIRETILSGDLLQAQLTALWRNWRDRFQRAPEQVFDPFLSLEGEVDTRRAVRAIYQALLGAAKARGLPRLRSQTPLEYQRTLEEAFPGTQDALNTITSSYQRARYAPQPPPTDHVEWVRQAWNRLRTTFEAQDDDKTSSAGGDM